VCDSLIAQALSSPRLDKDIADFSAQHPGELPPVIVGRFSNTSSEHIDTSIITSTMRSSIINSGKLDFVEDGTAREVVRKERNDQQQGNASDVSSARLGNETAAFFMLSGTVKAIVDQADGTMVRSYFVTASLINVETNRIVWEGSNNEIKKVVKRSKAKL
jgi:PBP1b-binding outer membrane lipoprotein LpoB